MNKMALVAVGYNRVNSLNRLLDSLNKAEYADDTIELYISLDKADGSEVVDFAQKFEWSHGEKIVLTYPERLGLRDHILKCGELLYKYDAIAILEDDIVVSEGFYNYMKQSVEFYSNDESIAGISLYGTKWNEITCTPFSAEHSEYDTYFFQTAESWGQIWLKKQWFTFKDWYNKHIDDNLASDNFPEYISNWPKSSWKKYHVKYCLDNNKYFVYPYVSLSTCFSDVGTHTMRMDTFIQVALYHGSKKKMLFPKLNNKDAVCYDVFYERRFLKYNILYNDYNTICFDLYGQKKYYEEKKYLISTKLLPYKVENSYGFIMKPHEENVFNNISGDSAFLYDLSHYSNKPIGNKLGIFRYRFSIYDHSIELLGLIADSIRAQLRLFLEKIFYRPF